MIQNKQKYLDKEEEELVKIYEQEETESIEDAETMQLLVQTAAKQYLEKNKNINIRLPYHDIQKIKAKAAESGLPYQTLIASLLHQYANDKIKAFL